MGTSRERGCLGEESPIHEGDREVRVRLPFDDDTVIDDVITDGQTFDSNVEVSASPSQIQQCSVSLGTVDAKQPLPRRIGDTVASGISINGQDVHYLEGKAKGPQSAETINESCKMPRRLRTSA